MKTQEVAIPVEVVCVAQHHIDADPGVEHELSALVVVPMAVRGRVRRRTVTPMGLSRERDRHAPRQCDDHHQKPGSEESHASTPFALGYRLSSATP